MGSEFPSPARFRKFEVIGKNAENRLITSFLLQPVEAADWKPFLPGQFLALRIPAAAGGHVVKYYSVSSDPAITGCYRITVKREEAPRADLPDGQGSCYLHRDIDVGALLEGDGPLGAFRLDQQSQRPLVLLSGGVGVTPMMAMLHAASRQPDRTVFFIHACRDGSVHAFADEVAEAAARRCGIHVHTVYEQARPEDRAARRHQAEGFIDRAMLQGVLPLDDYDFYLCGPGPFMKAIYAILRDLGVGKTRIAYEFFGPSALLEEPATAPMTAVPAGPVPPFPPTDRRTVSFVRSGFVASWTDTAGSLLELAERHGLRPDFSCRVGICGTCRVKLLSGAVDYVEPPLDPPADGEILLCCAIPLGPVALDF